MFLIKISKFTHTAHITNTWKRLQISFRFCGTLLIIIVWTFYRAHELKERTTIDAGGVHPATETHPNHEPVEDEFKDPNKNIAVCCSVLTACCNLHPVPPITPPPSILCSGTPCDTHPQDPLKIGLVWGRIFSLCKLSTPSREICETNLTWLWTVHWGWGLCIHLTHAGVLWQDWCGSWPGMAAQTTEALWTTLYLVTILQLLFLCLCHSIL